MNTQQLGNSLRNGSEFWPVLLAAKGATHGKSALTTYWSNRVMRNIPAATSLKLMRAQIKELGISYPGGFECTKFRN